MGISDNSHKSGQIHKYHFVAGLFGRSVRKYKINTVHDPSWLKNFLLDILSGSNGGKSNEENNSLWPTSTRPPSLTFPSSIFRTVSAGNTFRIFCVCWSYWQLKNRILKIENPPNTYYIFSHCYTQIWMDWLRNENIKNAYYNAHSYDILGNWKEKNMYWTKVLASVLYNKECLNKKRML